MNHQFYILFSIVLVVFIPQLSIAQQDFNGYYRGELGATTTEGNEVLFARNIFQGTLRSEQASWRYHISLQLRQDFAANEGSATEIRMREAYIDWFGDRFDIRAGQQMIVWGRSDATQLIDILTPYDLSEFLTQDFRDLRRGVTAVNMQYFRANNSFQFVLIPVFEPSSVPGPDSRWSFYTDNTINFEGTSAPSQNLQNMQYALKWTNRTNINFDFELAAFYGFHPLPVLEKRVLIDGFDMTVNARNAYVNSPALMTSGEYRVNSNISVQFESAYWLNRKVDVFPQRLRSFEPADFNDVVSTITENNASRFLAERSIANSMVGLKTNALNWQLSLQLLSDYIVAYESEDILQDEHSLSTSFLASRSYLNDDLTVRFLTRYNFNGKDFWVNPDATYSLSDGLQVNSGAHLFGGPEPEEYYGQLSFWQYRKNSFLYLKLTAYF
jgi:hypothetical protein